MYIKEDQESARDMYFDMRHEKIKSIKELILDNNEIGKVEYTLVSYDDLSDTVCGTIYRSLLFENRYVYYRMSEDLGAYFMFIVDYDNKIILVNEDSKISIMNFQDLAESEGGDFKVYGSDKVYKIAINNLNVIVKESISEMIEEDFNVYYRIIDKLSSAGYSLDYNITQNLIFDVYSKGGAGKYENINVKEFISSLNHNAVPTYDDKTEYHNLYTLYVALLNSNAIKNRKDYIMDEIKKYIENRPTNVKLVEGHLFNYVLHRKVNEIISYRIKYKKFESNEFNILEKILSSLLENQSNYVKTAKGEINLTVTKKNNTLKYTINIYQSFEYYIYNHLYRDNNNNILFAGIPINKIDKITHRNKVLYKG